MGTNVPNKTTPRFYLCTLNYTMNLNTIKSQLLSNWHLLRIIRLILAILILFQAWEEKNWMFGLLSGILFYQVIVNATCNGATCLPPENKLNESPTEIDYEEIQ